MEILASVFENRHIKKKRVFLAADMIRLIAHYLPYKELVNLIIIKKSIYAELVKTYGSALIDVARKYSIIRDKKDYYPKGKPVHYNAIRFIEFNNCKFIYPSNYHIHLDQYLRLQELRINKSYGLKTCNIPVLRAIILNSAVHWGREFASSIEYFEFNGDNIAWDYIWQKLRVMKCHGRKFIIDMNGHFPSLKHLDISLRFGGTDIRNLDKLDHDMDYVRVTTDNGVIPIYLDLLKNGELIEKHDGNDVEYLKYRNVKINGYNINIVCMKLVYYF